MATPSRPASMPSSNPKSGNSKSLGGYKLGNSLGKGAFGQVYLGLNFETGETVAIKEIQLSNIPANELPEIMSEIDLLKNLHHENIVQYKGFVKTREFLYIILELCENGSLHTVLKKFGKFPENLVAMYISQVLEGLLYLHDQGVIHRDIKGANLLTNKDGTVKLADFGVAARVGGVLDAAVVGSPYWMAPEVVEQTGATTASDIWSVGCVVIELLEGHPPYHNLDPMPALFRIVQDDCPPIPEGASPIVKDFLYHCFQKDPNLRISAKKLLKHPWMISARKQMDGGKGRNGSKAGEPTQGTSNSKRPLTNYNYDEAVLKVQEWNEALKSPSRAAKNPSRYTRQGSPLQKHSELPLSTSGGGGGGSLAPHVPGTLGLGLQVWKNASAKPGQMLVEKIQPQAFVLQPPEEQTDNWDDDFEGGISLTKIHALEKSTTEDDKSDASDENAQTIRPTKSPGVKPLPLAQPPAANISPIVEDYSDIATEEDEGWLEEKVADFKLKNSKKGLFHPDDIKTIGLGPVEAGPKSAPLTSLTKKSSRPMLTPLGFPTPASATVAPSLGSHGRSTSLNTPHSGTSGSGSFGRAEARRTQSQSQAEFGKYTEEDDEDYDDVFGKPNGNAPEQSIQTLQLNTRLSNKSWFGEDDDEEDPFAEIDEGFAEDDLETNLQRDKYARLCNSVNQLVDQLTPSTPDFQLREACDQLLSVLHESSEMHGQLVSSHGMLAILEVLEGRCSRDVIMKLLQIINQLVTEDVGFLESFCLIGGIPVMMEFTSKKYPSECRLEASNFIRLLCHTSVLTLQMFISCRGLKVLVDLLDEDYSEQTELVEHALNGITSVFELQSPTTKNDFCRMFIREGLLDPLSAALLNVMSLSSSGPSCQQFGTNANDSFDLDFNEDDDDTYTYGGPKKTEIDERSTKMKVVQILLVFTQVSQSDVHVRNALGTRKVVRRLLRACELLDPECLVQMLKAVKHLSMNATLHEVLQNANAIEILIRILEEQSTGPHSTEMANHIFQTCYNLCRLNKSRQEEAAQAGIIPCLKRVIFHTPNSPLKQFALPILCDLASAGKSCRTLLWQHDGVGMYMRLLDDPYFQVSALESVVSWLSDETARVEDRLVVKGIDGKVLNGSVNGKGKGLNASTNANGKDAEGGSSCIEALIRCFVTAKANSFENLLEPFLKMMRLSVRVTMGICRSEAFFKRVVDKLDPTSSSSSSSNPLSSSTSSRLNSSTSKLSSSTNAPNAPSSNGNGNNNVKAVVRLNLLRLLRYVCEVHPNRAVLVERYGLLGVVERLSKSGGDGAVLVKELAREIVPVLRPALRPALGSSVSSGATGAGSAGTREGSGRASGSGIGVGGHRRERADTSLRHERSFHGSSDGRGVGIERRTRIPQRGSRSPSRAGGSGVSSPRSRSPASSIGSIGSAGLEPGSWHGSGLPQSWGSTSSALSTGALSGVFGNPPSGGGSVMVTAPTPHKTSALAPKRARRSASETAGSSGLQQGYSRHQLQHYQSPHQQRQQQQQQQQFGLESSGVGSDVFGSTNSNTSQRLGIPKTRRQSSTSSNSSSRMRLGDLWSHQDAGGAGAGGGGGGGGSSSDRWL